jgi:hypothetical protein
VGACPVTPYAAEVLDPSFSVTWYHSGDLWAAPDVGNLGAWFADPDMTFPTAGCWEITGRIPGAELRFVVLAHPGEQHNRQSPPTMPGPDL